MKKIFLIIAVAMFGITSANAQNFSAGVTAGLPIGDFGDWYSFNIGLDVSTLWEVSDDFDAGISTGYNHSFGDEIEIGNLTAEVEDFQYIPLAGAARFNASEEFQIGADLGYAIALGDSDGGFYYRPMVGYNVSENTQISASYRGVSADGGSFSTINIGINFGL